MEEEIGKVLEKETGLKGVKTQEKKGKNLRFYLEKVYNRSDQTVGRFSYYFTYEA